MKRPNWLVWLDDWWDQSTAPEPLEEKAAVAMQKARKTILNCDHTIREHQFQKHMAKSEIQAMIDWFELEKESAP